MGCTSSGSHSRKETICLYRGNVIELEQRARTWERMYAELKRRVGKDEMEVSVVQPGSTVSLVTETTWASISDTKSRLVLLIQPDSVEETLSLEMTGFRKRDRKYTEVSQALTRLKSATNSFDRSFTAWVELSGQRDLPAALLLTYYGGPQGMRVSDQFPYLMAESPHETDSMWSLWLDFIAQLRFLDITIFETAKYLKEVASQRAIKRIGLFKKATINTSIAKAQENNVKMSLARERLEEYTTNVAAVKTAIAGVVGRLRTKTLQKPAIGKYRAALSSWVSLCAR